MKCPHCGWENCSSDRCELCEKSLLVGGGQRDVRPVGSRLDVVASVNRGDTLSHLLFRELWQVLEGRSTPDFALIALEQFWTSLEPFLVKDLPHLSRQAASLESQLRQIYLRLKNLLEGWGPDSPGQGLRDAMQELANILMHLQDCRKR